MSRKDDIVAILKVADDLYKKIETEYNLSLKRKSVDPKLPVYIKNYLENLRSTLDYIACEIAESVLSLPSSHKPYFPISCNSHKLFSHHMSKNLPGLDLSRKDIYDTIEKLQSYQTNGCLALPRLSKLVNENKHNRLSEQTREEKKGLEIKFPGGARISMPPGASISGGGVISSGGGWFSPAGDTISGDRPIKSGQNIEQTVTIWVSFSFSETGDEVLSLLKDCRSDVDRILSDLSSYLWS